MDLSWSVQLRVLQGKLIFDQSHSKFRLSSSLYRGWCKRSRSQRPMYRWIQYQQSTQKVSVPTQRLSQYFWIQNCNVPQLQRHSEGKTQYVPQLTGHSEMGNKTYQMWLTYVTNSSLHFSRLCLTDNKSAHNSVCQHCCRLCWPGWNSYHGWALIRREGCPR